MANDAAKKNAKLWSIWVKIIAAVTAIINLLFLYCVYDNENFGIWTWIAYIFILISYWVTIRQVLNSIAHGLPRPEMYWDGLITAWVINIFIIFSGWAFWLFLWVPAVYIYKAINAWKQFAPMTGMGAQPTQGTQQNYANQQSGRKKRKKRKRRA
eukprot:258197_1